MSTPENATCSIDECDKDVEARGWCRKHYGRWRRCGDPLTVKPNSLPKHVGCSVDGCERKHASLGLCVAHYKRLRRWGDPLIARPLAPPEERFLARVNKDGPLPPTFRNRGPCWIWTAGVTAQGYGMFNATKQQQVLVHRWSYEHHVGPIPEGLVIDHLCRVRRCVNPRHLEPVTIGVNTLRGLSVATFNKLKTHCPAEHEYTPANTYVTPKGTRSCRECARARDRQPHRQSAYRRQITHTRNREAA